MNTRITALAMAALMGLVASEALAAQVNAKLQTPIEGRKKLVAAGAVFACEADTCTATDANAFASGCRELVRVVGAVTEYGAEGKLLDAEKLAACNSSAKKK